MTRGLFTTILIINIIFLCRTHVN